MTELLEVHVGSHHVSLVQIEFCSPSLLLNHWGGFQDDEVCELLRTCGACCAGQFLDLLLARQCAPKY